MALKYYDIPRPPIFIQIGMIFAMSRLYILLALFVCAFVLFDIIFFCGTNINYDQDSRINIRAPSYFGLSSRVTDLRKDINVYGEKHVVFVGGVALKEKFEGMFRQHNFLKRSTSTPSILSRTIDDYETEQLLKINVTLCVDCTTMLSDFKEMLIRPEYVRRTANILSYFCHFLDMTQQACKVFVFQYTEEILFKLSDLTDPILFCISIGFCNFPPPP